jgi:hypothetical protein
MFETMHLETHALEYNFGACRVGDLLDDCSDLSGAESGRRKKNIELRRKQPERSDVELTSLRKASRTSQYTVQRNK